MFEIWSCVEPIPSKYSREDSTADREKVASPLLMLDVADCVSLYLASQSALFIFHNVGASKRVHPPASA